MNLVSFNLLGIEGVTLETPQFPQSEPDNIKVMSNLKKRLGAQGAERVTVIPNRNGSGWVAKKESTDA